MPLGEARRLATYGLVGVVNTGVDFAAFFALLAGGVPPLAANAAGFGAGACVSYLLNGTVTFRTGVRLRSWSRVLRFAAVTGACLAASSLVLAAGLALGATALVGKVLATGATLVLGYALNRTLVFNAPKAAA